MMHVANCRAAAEFAQNLVTSSCATVCARGCLCHSTLCDVQSMAILLICISEGFCNAIDCPVHLVALNNEWRGDADNVLMRIPGQDPPSCKRLAKAAGTPSFRIELNSNHQAPPTNLFNLLVKYAFQSGFHVCALFCGVFDHAFLDENAECRPGNCTGERITAKGGAMIARLEGTH